MDSGKSTVNGKICKYCGKLLIRKPSCPDKQWENKKFCNKKCKRLDKNPYIK